METILCNLCGGDNSRLRFPRTLPADARSSYEAFRCTHPGYGQHHAIVQCQTCGLYYANPRPTQAELMNLYAAVEDTTYLEEQEGRRLTFARHLRQLEKSHRPPGRLLDIGAYTGVFVEIAAQSGWEAWGLEPSHWGAAHGRSRGLNLVEGDLSTATFEPATFDVITLWDVIEHMADPQAELRKIHTLLRPGGLVVVHTMDIESLTARLMGPKWFWLMEMHLFFFSKRTLAALLTKTGFTVTHAALQGRYLRAGYLGSRLTSFNAGLSQNLRKLLQRLHLDDVSLYVNSADLFTMYAIRQ